MKTYARLSKITLALLLTFVLSACEAAPRQSQTQASSVSSITVSASSSVQVVPDRARVVVGVRSQATSAQDAQSAGSTAANRLVDALKALGIEDGSIQTSFTELFPIYGQNSDEEIAVFDLASATENEIIGYEMRIYYQVSDLEIDQVGDVLRESVTAGATDFDGIAYYASSYDEAYNEALTQAVDATLEKAEVLADAAGVDLGAIISIEEGYQNTSIRYDTLATAELEDSASTLVVEPGVLEVEAHVSASYAISS